MLVEIDQCFLLCGYHGTRSDRRSGQLVEVALIALEGPAVLQAMVGELPQPVELRIADARSKTWAFSLFDHLRTNQPSIWIDGNDQMDWPGIAWTWLTNTTAVGIVAKVAR